MESPVTFDQNCYQINGQPAWLASGEIHYFKMTRGDWRRRLLQLRLAGFNTVSMYIPWNYHELHEGEWDFSGDRDIAEFMRLAAELGLYVVARPGPFICDEWLAGGFPPWLSAKPGIRLRTSQPKFLEYVDKWWDRIAPIIAEYQIGRNGSVILVQVENEYGHLGPYQEADYIYHLRDGLRERGVAVPIISCDSFIRFPRLQPRAWDGINMSCNFGGDALRNLAAARDLQPNAPLFVTEYWIAAFDWWGRQGSAERDHATAACGAVSIAAGGAAGLTAFVFSGGAHFGYWHGRSIMADNCFMTTLYGPGAPILDDGIFNEKYYLFKKLMTGLMAGESELSQAGMPEINDKGEGLIKAVRRGPKAQFTFYMNQSREERELADEDKEQAAVDFSIPAGASMWSVKNLPLNGGFTLLNASADLFAAQPALVLSSEANKIVAIDVAADSSIRAENFPGDAVVENHDNSVHIRINVPEGEWPATGMLIAGEARLPVIVLNDDAVRHCWRVALPGAPAMILGGPDRIEDAVVREGRLELKLSASTDDRSCWIADDQGLREMPVDWFDDIDARSIILEQEMVCHHLSESTKGYDDSDWFEADQPQPMATFGHGHGRAWYRTKINVKESGPQMLYFSGACDYGHIWVNGKYATDRGTSTNTGWNTVLHLPAGEHTLAILVDNLGMYNTGAEFDIPLGEPKGLFGPVWLNGEPVQGWKMRSGVMQGERVDYWPQVAEGLAGVGPPDEDVLRGPVWLRASFRRPENFDGSVRLLLGDSAVKGSVWVNGYNVGRYWKLGPQKSLWLPLSRLKDVNDIVIFEETEIVPRRIRVHYEHFGYHATVQPAEAYAQQV